MFIIERSKQARNDKLLILLTKLKNVWLVDGAVAYEMTEKYKWDST
jgi:hypothetical protein